MSLLEALRAVTSFTPPPALPDCDLDLLGDVLEAHGLAPLASYQLEHTRLGAGVPSALRERLLGHYQGVANDNVLKLVTLRGLLRDAPDVPVVLLEGAAYVDWIYPHLAFRPVGDLRIAVRAGDGGRLAESVAPGFRVDRADHGGRTAVLSDGRLSVAMQEGLWPGGPEDARLFERAVARPAFGPMASRPSAEDALLAAVADQALLGLLAPLVTFVDVRELVRLEPDPAVVLERAGSLGLSRALHGSMRLVARFFPDVAALSERLRPELSLAERVAVEGVVEAASDPARLRHLRGVDAVARRIVAP